MITATNGFNSESLTFTINLKDPCESANISIDLSIISNPLDYTVSSSSTPLVTTLDP